MGTLQGKELKHYAPQLDLFTGMVDNLNGEVLRDRGIEQVLSHNVDWKEQCIDAFYKYQAVFEETFTGEDIRRYLQSLNLYPSHPNAWGGLINSMQRKGLIVPTGQWVPMADKRSHARKTPLYRRP